MATFPERLLRACLLDADLYEEVEADAGAGADCPAVSDGREARTSARAR